MRHHIPEEFIIDLRGGEYRVKRLCHERDLLHQRSPQLTVKMEQFGDMIFGEQQRVAGKILVTVEDYVRVRQFRDAQVGIGFPAGAHRAVGIIHLVLQIILYERVSLGAYSVFGTLTKKIRTKQPGPWPRKAPERNGCPSPEERPCPGLS